MIKAKVGRPRRSAYRKVTVNIDVAIHNVIRCLLKEGSIKLSALVENHLRTLIKETKDG
jgi:hypothetical protein